jgi:glycosyltransferase involved in cell wall biosynthesis
MKVLILTYYWPPAGGSGVQRWLYFAKYLHEFGVEPVIFTVKNPNYPIDDVSLEKHVPKDIEIIRQKIWEPNSVLSVKQKKTGAGFLSENPTLIQRVTHYIRANFFIPDARKFWIKPSVKKLQTYLETNKIDWIISTGPPHSVHLIGEKLHDKTGVKWLADFRDPWTEIDYFHQLPLTKKSLQKHTILEKKVLQNANLVTVVSQTMAKKYKIANSNCHVITNGFDGEMAKDTTLLDKNFSLTHVGLLNADRNPTLFWEIVRELIDENQAFKEKIEINLIGKIADEVKDDLQKNKLDKYVNIVSYLPHDHIFSHISKSQVLLVFVNKVPSAKGIVTGKIFEYFRANRPIVAIAPIEGDLSKILQTTKTGVCVDFHDRELLKKQLLVNFNSFISNTLQSSAVGVEKYTRKNLTKQLVELLKNN